MRVAGSGGQPCACGLFRRGQRCWAAGTTRRHELVRALRRTVRLLLFSQAQEECWFSFIYSKYIPFAVRERFVRDPLKLQQHEVHVFEGVVAFIDVSGFTKVTSSLRCAVWRVIMATRSCRSDSCKSSAPRVQRN